jgi:dimethylaniline monooxygenase (N-oxide forming)
LILKEYRKLGINGGLNHFGIPETNFDLNSVRLTPSSDLLSALKNKEITIKPGIKKFLKNKVIFTDDSEQSIDAVIFATGYTFKFPFLASDIIDINANDLDLYKYIFHPKLPNLAFIGMCIVQGPFPPVFEMQARWAARVLSGKLHLPSQDYMYADIRKKRVHLQKIGGRPMMVMLIAYMDELANEIGVKPRLLKHIRYIYKILFGPFSPSQYRLDGPGSWDKAIQAIKDIS